jgi:hypothetical protein
VNLVIKPNKKYLNIKKNKLKLNINKGVNWLQGLASFQSDSPHQIIFEGIRGPTDISDIVIKIKLV